MITSLLELVVLKYVRQVVIVFGDEADYGFTHLYSHLNAGFFNRRGAPTHDFTLRPNNFIFPGYFINIALALPMKYAHKIFPLSNLTFVPS
jgi:hypothetical protein